MKSILTIEFRRLLKSYSFYIAIGIGLFISISQVVQYCVPLAKINATEAYLAYEILPHSVFNNMMGFGNGWQASVLINLAPLLAVIPFAHTFYIDKKNGYLKNMYTKNKRRNYVIAKYIVTFFSGGFVLMLPWLVNLLGALMVLPYIKPIAGSHLFDLEGDIFWSGLFYNYPVLYVVAFSVMCFLIGGFCACMSLSATYIVNGIFLTELFPFIFITVYNLVIPVLDKDVKFFLSSQQLLSILQNTGGITLKTTMISLILFFSVSIIYFYQSLREDCL